MSFTVLVPGPVPPFVDQALTAPLAPVRLWQAEDPDALLRAVGPEVRGIACGGHVAIGAALMERLPGLEIVANFGVGYDSVDTAYAAAHGIVVTNTPDVLTEEVADTALALILNVVRQFPAAERHLRTGAWPSGPFALSPTLRGRTVGILGLGRIGKAIARRCEAFGLTVVYHGRQPQDGIGYRYCPTVLALAEASDILVVIAPGGAGTRHLVDAAVLKALGPDGYLVNVARGSLVDEAALVAALADGTIRGAGLDVFDNEPHVPADLIGMDHVVLLPHVGSASVHTRQAMGDLVVANLRSWAAGQGPVTPVAETPWRGADASAP